MERPHISSDWLSARAAVSSRDTALVVSGRAYTFRQLDGMVSALCGYLTRQNIGRGDHVGMLMPNSLAAVCLVFSAARIGAVLVPLNTRLTAEELRWQISHSHCACVVCLETNEQVAREATGDQVPVYPVPQSIDEFQDWIGRLPTGAGSRYAPIDMDSLQAIMFTSGTTGFPKGAMIIFDNHFWSAVGSAFKLGVMPNDRWLACLPLYHVGGLAILFRSCIYGTTVVLHDGFEVDAVLGSLARDDITIVSLVPTMLSRLMECGLSGKTAPNLRLVLLGGAAATTDLLAQASAASLPVAITYGLTEACSQVATMLPATTREKPGSVGQPLFSTEILILEDDGREAPPNIPGEITIKGPTVMRGYYEDQPATAASLHGSSLHTGDIGYKDDDGDLWVLDRRSDLIVSGGENVYPAEVERVLTGHPSVKVACVIGLPHPDWGKQVAAIVVLHDGASLSADELLEYSRLHLAGYKQPRAIFFSDTLPLTGSGKVQRKKVVENLAVFGKPA